jgi:hypothetical protein
MAADGGGPPDPSNSGTFPQNASERPSPTGAGQNAPITPPELPKASVRDFKKQEDSDVRARLAYVLAIIFGATILISFGLLMFALNEQLDAPHWGPAKDLISNLLAAETGLFGTVLGFYFGGKAASKQNGS